MHNELTPSSKRLSEASESRNRSENPEKRPQESPKGFGSGSAGRRHLLFTSDGGKSVMAEEDQSKYDDKHIISEKQLCDDKSMEEYFKGKPFKKDDFIAAHNYVAKSRKYDHLAKLDFLPAYFKDFVEQSPYIGENITKFKILRSWKKNAQQPHHDFAVMVLNAWYKRYEPSGRDN
jgi:hypothetical protein